MSDVATETTTEVSQGPPGDPLLTLQNVEVVYNEISLAVRGISLVVPQGKTVALLGANGAGKTTTLRAIAGLLDIHDGRVREGDVLFDDRDISSLRPDQRVRAGIAQVPEGRMVFGHLTVEENLRVGAAATGYRSIRRSLETVFEIFPPLADRRRQQAGWMSGGEQQMIAVGRALMAEPRLLLLDEVSLGLAPQIIDSIIRQLDLVRSELGTAMLMVEQNANLALDFSDYGYIMENGRVVLDGPSEQLRRNEDVREFYLGLGDHEAEKKSYADVKHYKRRKRWVA